MGSFLLYRFMMSDIKLIMELWNMSKRHESDQRTDNSLTPPTGLDLCAIKWKMGMHLVSCAIIILYKKKAQHRSHNAIFAKDRRAYICSVTVWIPMCLHCLEVMYWSPNMYILRHLNAII